MANGPKGSEDEGEAGLAGGTATERLREAEAGALVSRRGVLWKAGLATAVGVGAAALSSLDQQRADAATGGSFILGQANNASSATGLTAAPTGTIGFSQAMTIDGTGVTISALDVSGPAGGAAIYGHLSSGVATSGTATSGTGVLGTSTSGTGVRGTSSSGAGVVGSSSTGDAIQGSSVANGKHGVIGTDTSPTGGTGVSGVSTHGVGVRATSTTGDALYVNGKTHFTRAGSGTIAAGHTNLAVSVSGLTSSSLVLVTLQRAVTGVYVLGVNVTTGHFTAYINTAAPSSIKFAWFVLAG